MKKLEKREVRSRNKVR